MDDLGVAVVGALAEQFPERAAYAVSLAYRIRYVMQFNAREAMHLIELRTSVQGHPSYRAVGQEMHRLIAEQAGHRAIAEMMRFVDHSGEAELERLEAERRAEARRAPPRRPEAGDRAARPAAPGGHAAAPTCVYDAPVPGRPVARERCGPRSATWARPTNDGSWMR